MYIYIYLSISLSLSIYIYCIIAQSSNYMIWFIPPFSQPPHFHSEEWSSPRERRAWAGLGITYVKSKLPSSPCFGALRTRLPSCLPGSRAEIVDR